ncbi:MAG: hypothetical protein AB1611_10565 [bacterium]
MWFRSKQMGALSLNSSEWGRNAGREGLGYCPSPGISHQGVWWRSREIAA